MPSILYLFVISWHKIIKDSMIDYDVENATIISFIVLISIRHMRS